MSGSGDDASKGIHRRGMMRGLLAVGATTSVSACGFQPVYMPTASGKAGPAERGFAATEVSLIPERPGQLLRQELQARLGSDAAIVAPRYKLAVSYSISGEGIAVYTDSNATVIRFIGTAIWSLNSAVPGGQRVTSGSARALEDMNLFDQQYLASDLETEAIQRRLARHVADRIAMQLAVWFREHPDQAG